MRLQKLGAVRHIGAQLVLVELGLERATVVVVTGIAADRKQSIRCQGKETFNRAAPCHVLDVGIEAAIFVHHQHRRERSVALGLHQVAAHLA